MSEPFAYLLTWTCYGTWLHGDSRGSVDVDHNIPGTPFVEPDPARIRQAQATLRFPSVSLDSRARKLVEKTIEAHCLQRGWELHAVHARTNHVHVVISARRVTPEKTLTQLKAWTTRRLRETGAVASDQRVWTAYGSTRYLWDERGVSDAVDYVQVYQGHDLD